MFIEQLNNIIFKGSFNINYNNNDVNFIICKFHYFSRVRKCDIRLGQFQKTFHSIQ